MGGVSNLRQRFELIRQKIVENDAKTMACLRECRASIERAFLDLETALIEQQRRIQRAFEA